MKPLSDGHEFAVFNEEVREWIHSNRESGGSIRKLLVGSKHLQTLSTSEIPHILGSSGHLNLYIGVKSLFVPRSLQMSSSITTLCFCQKLSGGWYRAPVTGVGAPSSDLIVLPIINMGEMFFTNIFIQQFSFVYCEPKCFTPQLSHFLNKTRVFLSWPMTTLSARVTISPPGRPVSIPVAGTSQGGLPLQCLKLSPPRSCGPSEIPFFSLISLLFSSWIDFRPRHRVAESVITFGTCFICFRNSES